MIVKALIAAVGASDPTGPLTPCQQKMLGENDSNDSAMFPRDGRSKALDGDQMNDV